MSDETQTPHDEGFEDGEGTGSGEVHRPWFSNESGEEHPHAPNNDQTPHDWRTAAELSHAASTHADDGGARLDGLADSASADKILEEVDLHTHDTSEAGEPALPEGIIDLTDEAPQPEEDSVRISASLYRGETAAEPVHGTVEVDQSVTQSNETVIMPVESALDDRRAARARALGEVDPGVEVIAAPLPFTPPSTYKVWPSFVLFVFRLVIATILSIRATQEWANFSQTRGLWATSILPSPGILAGTQIAVEYLIALMLLVGVASRAAGVLLVVLYVSVLSFITWGAVNPFARGVIGFRGEWEVLMVVIGLVFAGIGGGGAAVDGAVHRARLERKNAKL